MNGRGERSFAELLKEAEQQPFTGWDFSYIAGRWREGGVSWDYEGEVRRRACLVQSLLDMGTGGGEFLSTIEPLPPVTCATEGYPPNLAIAKARLNPLGIRVFPVQDDGCLPFPEATFDLVVNRHDSFSAREVHRVLKDGGTFLTQQVGGRENLELNRLLCGDDHHEYSFWTLDFAATQLREAGFRIIEQREEFPATSFYDVGAVVYYLKAIPWQVPGFSVARYRKQLAEIHRTISSAGELVVTSHFFYIEAVK